MQQFYNRTINNEHNLAFINSRVITVTPVTLNNLKHVTKKITAENHRNLSCIDVPALQNPVFLCLSLVPLSMTVFIVCGHMLRKLG